MDDDASARWKRWQSGTFRIHLNSGGWVDITGRVRVKETRDNAVSYEAETDSVVFLPAFGDVTCIEVR